MERYALMAIALLAAPNASLSAATDSAQSVVESQVFVAGKLVGHARTLIFDEKVVDFTLKPNKEIVVWDQQNHKFELWDPQRKQRCALSELHLLELVTGLNLRAKKLSSRIRVAADPEFAITFDSEKNVLMCAHPQLTYRVQARHADFFSLRYLEFADWSARLNAIRKHGLPPAARLQVNQQLRQREMLPAQVTRREPLADGEDFVAESRHTYRRTLTKDDRRRIQDLTNMRQQYDLVPLRQFVQMTPERDR